MYSVKNDNQKRRIYMVLGGRQAMDEVQQFQKEVYSLVDQYNRMGQGFTVLADMREFTPQVPEVTKLHEEAQLYCAKKGLLGSAFVMPAKAISQLQINRVGKSTGVIGANNNFSSVAEAENYLDGLSK